MSRCTPPTLRTPRLLIRPLKESDRAEYIRGHEDSAAHLRRWSPLAAPGRTTDEAFADDLARSLAAEESGAGCRRVAELLPDACGVLGIDPARRTPLVAYINLNNISRGSFQCADIGWRVMREFVGRGLGTEAVLGMLDLAFSPSPDGLGLHRVQANVMPSNLPSLALAKRAGFRREGFAPRMLCIAGEWEDHIMHAKLAEEHPPRTSSGHAGPN